ncbi:MAG: glycosyltransferase [Candidatus Marinimicrobia bacterium]|nr:glycosyltransferase [Candidatus Neomarinimicrobiota bacterium]
MNIAIVSTNKDKYSETFIQAQVKLLPANVHLLHSGYLPTLSGQDDQPLVKNTIVTKIQKWMGRSNEQMLQQAVSKYLQQNKIQLVLAQYGPSGVKMMDICHSMNIPLFVYFRGYDAYRKEILDSYGKFYPQLFKIATKLFVVSHEMKDQLVRLGADKGKIIYNPSGADINRFTYHNAGKNPRMFLSVGRFEETKNQNATILAFQHVVEKFPDARLILVGDGPLRESCTPLVTSLNLGHAIEFTGILPHDDIARLMSQSRAFVLHSTTPPSGDKEGTPVSIMEASASGLPVVSTIHAGIPDVVTDGETGYLVDEGDIDGMADRMMRFANDPNLATQFGLAGHRLINDRFTQKHNIDLLWKTIQQCVNRSVI